MTAPPLTIRLFGPFAAYVHGESLPPVRTRSVEWVLALLALRHGRAVSRSWLAGTLWPESEESRALKNLRNDLVFLRQALGPEAVRIQSPSRDTLTLDLACAEVDVVAFDDAIRRGDEAALQEAVDAYGGTLLEGCYEPWAEAERFDRAEQYLLALERRAEIAGARGDHAEAVRLLRRAESQEPLRESIARRLMESLAATGDAPAAVQVYRRLRSGLLDELSVAPDEETTRLFREILAGARAGEAQRSSRSLRQRQRTADRPAVDAPPSPIASSETPPASGRQVLRHGPRICPPPTPVTGLIGREEELREIQARLAQSRLVTLVGAGGIGKTRLAMEVARTIADRVDGGAVVAWVELAPVTDEALVVSAIAAAMEAGSEAGSGGDTLSALIGALLAHGPLLLVLDNCEHVVDAVAGAVETLLRACPDVSVLATSRERLALQGETVWRVPSLATRTDPSVTQPGQAPGSALQSPAARLFLERARAARASFAVADHEDEEAVCAICERLDGIPLAIELAAARISALTPRQIGDRLDDRFAILTTGSRTAPPRHKTLRALIDWSHALLAPEERTLFRRLSVFIDGWALEAAEAVARSAERPGGDQVSRSEDPLDLLSSLVDKSLAVVAPGSAGLRYRMLETIREYGVEKLREAGEEAVARNGHLACFVALAEELAPALRDPDPSEGLGRVEAEMGNFRAALMWAQAPEATPGGHGKLAAALWPYWLHRGSQYEGCVHLQGALDGLQDRASPTWEELLRGSRELANQLHFGYRQLADRSLRDLGDGSLWQKEHDRATAVLERALEMHLRLGQKPEMVVTLRCLGLAIREQGDRARGLSCLHGSAAVARELGNRLYLGLTLHELGCALIHDGAYEEARKALEEALALLRQPGGDYGIGIACNNLGGTLLRLGANERAGELYREGLEYYARGPSWDGLIWSVEGLALAGMSAAVAANAARLLGAVASAFREPQTSMSRWEPAVAAVRGALGEDAFRRAFGSGRERSCEEAIGDLVEGGWG